MKTLTNGVPAEWSDDIRAKWAEVVKDASGPVVIANYFTPRPYRNAYDRGRSEEGFTYTAQACEDRHLKVFQVIINAGDSP